MSISEAYFYAMHPEEQHVQGSQEEMKFDVSFLLYLVPEEHEWIQSLMK
jgi:hypothetical protein